MILGSLVLLASCSGQGSRATSEPTTTSATEDSTTVADTTTTITDTTTLDAPSARVVPAVEGPIVDPAGSHRYINPGAVVEADGSFHMLANSFSVWPGRSEVYHFTSADGLSWEGQGVVMDGETEPFADEGVFVMEVLVESGQWVAYFYTYAGPDHPSHIGRATAPGPEGPWSVLPEPVLSPGPEGSWDGAQVVEPSVIETDEGYAMFYAGTDSNQVSAIGLATSTDGIEWVKHPDPVLTGTDGWDRGTIGNPDVAATPDGLVMIFDTFSRNQGYGLATSSDGVTWEMSAGPIFTRSDTQHTLPLWQGELVETSSGYRFYIEVGSGTRTRVHVYDLSLQVP